MHCVHAMRPNDDDDDDVGVSELSMGPLCVTRSNPTHQLTDPTEPTKN